MRKVDIGMCSYRNPECLIKALASITEKCSDVDYRLLIVDNHSDDKITYDILYKCAKADPRITLKLLEENKWYQGAVNEFLKWSEAEYIFYVENDAQVLTDRAADKLAIQLDEAPQIGIIGPSNIGCLGINKGNYTEVFWFAGFAWMMKRSTYLEVGLLDEAIGHQNEIDYQIRVRLAGKKIAIANNVTIAHHATTSLNPDATERINKGVEEWMNKWLGYFCGKDHADYDYTVQKYDYLRMTDWNVCARYLEEYFKQFVPDLNAHPETIVIEGVEYDLLKVPRAKNYYTGRII